MTPASKPTLPCNVIGSRGAALFVGYAAVLTSEMHHRLFAALDPSSWNGRATAYLHSVHI